jgi:hypothetical protein
MKRGKNATCEACLNKIATFHSNTISEGGLVVGYDGQSKRRDLKEQKEKIRRSRSKGNTWCMIKIRG